MKIDEVCGKVFLKEQGKLFPKPVAESLDEAMDCLLYKSSDPTRLEL